MKTSASLPLTVGTLLLTLSVSAGAENAITSGSAIVRAGPDSSYPEVAQLEADTPIQVIGCLDDWSWCDVGFEDYRGWLYAPVITYEYEGGYVPLYSYAPRLGVPVVAFSIDGYWGSHYRDRPWYAQRDEWVRRGSARHERPPGPPPSDGPPPREARVDRPRPESHTDRSLRLGSAEPQLQPPHQSGERRDGAADSRGAREPDRRAEDRSPAATSRAEPPHAAEPPRAEDRSHATPSRPEPPRAEPPSRPTERAAPQRNEERSPPAQQAGPPRHEEQPAAQPPHKDERGDHPQDDNHE